MMCYHCTAPNRVPLIVENGLEGSRGGESQHSLHPPYSQYGASTGRRGVGVEETSVCCYNMARLCIKGRTPRLDEAGAIIVEGTLYTRPYLEMIVVKGNVWMKRGEQVFLNTEETAIIWMQFFDTWEPMFQVIVVAKGGPGPTEGVTFDNLEFFSGGHAIKYVDELKDVEWVDRDPVGNGLTYRCVKCKTLLDRGFFYCWQCELTNTGYVSKDGEVRVPALGQRVAELCKAWAETKPPSSTKTPTAGAAPAAQHGGGSDRVALWALASELALVPLSKFAHTSGSVLSWANIQRTKYKPVTSPTSRLDPKVDREKINKLLTQCPDERRFELTDAFKAVMGMGQELDSVVKALKKMCCSDAKMYRVLRMPAKRGDNKNANGPPKGSYHVGHELAGQVSSGMA